MKIFATLAALVAATAVAAPAHDTKVRDLEADDAPHTDDQNLISAVMRAHWYWRTLHCAQPLVWDGDLANAAKADIEECTEDPEHVGGRHSDGQYSPSNVGRNAPAATFPQSSPFPTATMLG